MMFMVYIYICVCVGVGSWVRGPVSIRNWGSGGIESSRRDSKESQIGLFGGESKRDERIARFLEIVGGGTRKMIYNKESTRARGL